MTEPLLTTRELADRLRITTPTVYRYLKAGRIPALRLGPRMTRDRLSEVLAALDRPTTPNPAPSSPSFAMDRAAAADAGVAPRVAALRADGLSYGRVAARLNADGRRTRTGAAWVAAHVQRVERWARRRALDGVPAKALEADPPPPAPARIPGAAAVDRIRQLRAAKSSWLQIANQLNAESIPTPSGDHWSKRSVRLALEQAGVSPSADAPYGEDG